MIEIRSVIHPYAAAYLGNAQISGDKHPRRMGKPKRE
jgi:hypothetical protein